MSVTMLFSVHGGRDFHRIFECFCKFSLTFISDSGSNFSNAIVRLSQQFHAFTNMVFLHVSCDGKSLFQENRKRVMFKLFQIYRDRNTSAIAQGKYLAGSHFSFSLCPGLKRSHKQIGFGISIKMVFNFQGSFGNIL